MKSPWGPHTQTETEGYIVKIKTTETYTVGSKNLTPLSHPRESSLILLDPTVVIIVKILIKAQYYSLRSELLFGKRGVLLSSSTTCPNLQLKVYVQDFKTSRGKRMRKDKMKCEPNEVYQPRQAY